MDAFKRIRALYWVGNSKKDLQALPEDVQDIFGFALHLAQEGGKHQQTKSLKGFTGAGVLEIIEDYNRNTYRAVYTVSFDSAVYVLHCFQKKSTSGIKTSGHDIALIRSRLKLAEAHSRGKKMTEIEASSGNVYADLNSADANEMLVKAQLASKICSIIKASHLTQVQAAAVLGLPQPKVSEMMRGKFRGISETKMIDCLARLGRDVQIVIKPAPRSRREGRVEVIFT